MTAAVVAALATLVIGVGVGIALFRPRRPAPTVLARPATSGTPGLVAATPRVCDYCTTAIPVQATRCPSCAGEFRYCPTDQRLVGMTSHQKFVGLVRGGTKTQHRCLHCGRVLDGPRF